MALTTFVGQNLGARQYDRVLKGAKFGMICSMTLAELIGVIILCSVHSLLRPLMRHLKLFSLVHCVDKLVHFSFVY